MESLKLVEIFGFGTKVFSKRGTILETKGKIGIRKIVKLFRDSIRRFHPFPSHEGPNLLEDRSAERATALPRFSAFRLSKNRHWNHGLRSLNPRIEAFMHNSWPRLRPLRASPRGVF